MSKTLNLTVTFGSFWATAELENVPKATTVKTRNTACRDRVCPRMTLLTVRERWDGIERGTFCAEAMAS